jgi:hypothetical protein
MATDVAALPVQENSTLEVKLFNRWTFEDVQVYLFK